LLVIKNLNPRNWQKIFHGKNKEKMEDFV
jgi:hypothetical protein